MSLLDVPRGLATAPRSAPSQVPSVMRPWRLLALLAGLGYVLSAVHPFRDPDVYWHVLLGREILERGTVRGVGADWSYGLRDAEWTTTQWLSEVLFALVQSTAGWGGIEALRVAAAAAFAVGLAAVLLRKHPSPWAALVYVAALVVCSVSLQERAQLVSMLLLLWLAAAVRALLAGAAGPHVATVLVVTALWANLHGLWILVPAVLGLLTLGFALEGDGMRVRRCALVTGTALVAGCLTPVGWSLLLSPFRFSAAGELLAEWQATSFDNPVSVTFGLLVVALLSAWCTDDRPAPTPALIVTVGLVAFSLTALRNVPPATVLLAPVVVGALEGRWPRKDAASSRTEARALSTVATCAVLLLVPVLAGRVAATPTLPDDVPFALLERLADEPGEHRVLNDYNVSGAVLLWGGTDTTVRVDGRADRYGAAYIREHQELMALRSDWQSVLAADEANAALLEDDAPLVAELRRRGWSVLAREDGHVLLTS